MQPPLSDALLQALVGIAVLIPGSAMAFDARRRGDSAAKWFFGTLLFPYVAIPIRFWPRIRNIGNTYGSGALAQAVRTAIIVAFFGGVLVSVLAQHWLDPRAPQAKPLGVVVVLLSAFAILWISKDADQTSQTGWRWFLLTLFLAPVAIPYYLLRRFVPEAGFAILVRSTLWSALLGFMGSWLYLAVAAFRNSARDTFAAMGIGALVVVILFGFVTKRYVRRVSYRGGVMTHATPWRYDGAEIWGGLLILAILGAFLGVAARGGTVSGFW